MPFITRLPALTGADPYPDALLALDFVGARRGPQYYKALGVTTADITKIPGWTYTGGTPAGTGSYAARSDGSLQFFPSYTNLLLQSQTFDNAQWSKGATTVTANAISAPDGTTTADKVSETAVVNTHYVSSASITVTAATQYTHSFYIKAAERGYAAIYDGVKGQGKFFNLSSGTVLGNLVAAPDSATITDAGGGWWRASITVTPAGTTATPAVYVSSDGTSFNYLGTAGSGIYVWGGMTNLGSTASTYIPTTTAAVTVGTPRITDAGYDVWESRTNSIRNNSMVGAVAGTPGTAPTNWVLIAGSGLSWSVAGTGTENGAPYVDIRLSGTGAGSLTSVVRFDAVSAASASASQSWTASAWFRLAGGSTANISATTLVGGTSTDGVSISSVFGTNAFAITSTATRFAVSGTTGASTTNVVEYLQISSTAGAVDITVRIYQPQLELGSFATPPIPTTSVAVTRAADVGYVSGFANALGTPLTIVVNYSGTTLSGGSGSLGIASLDDGSTANRVRIGALYATGNAQQTVVTAGSVLDNTISASVRTLSGLRQALRITSDGSVTTAVNGTIDIAQTSALSIPTTSRLSFGSVPGSVPLNGTIRRIVIYPRAMSNSELQAITTAGAY